MTMSRSESPVPECDEQPTWVGPALRREGK
jgi:hypothetical protein